MSWRGMSLLIESHCELTPSYQPWLSTCHNLFPFFPFHFWPASISMPFQHWYFDTSSRAFHLNSDQSMSMFTNIRQELFASGLHRCSGPGAEYPGGKAHCSGNFVFVAATPTDTPFLVPRAWERPQLHFDDIFSASLALLSCSALNWVAIMHDCIDITAPNVSPLQDANWWERTELRKSCKDSHEFWQNKEWAY